MKRDFDVAVIGAGAAGMMAAISAAREGASVAVFEKNVRTGRKLRITGKGRCNVTNNCTVQEFMSAVPENSKFLYSALAGLSPSDTISFFEDLGVPLKTERGRRVFPVSDNAHDIANALEREAGRLGVETMLGAAVTSLLSEETDGVAHVTGIVANGMRIGARAVIVATGGVSYPATGSTGDGYRFAERLGLKVISPMPSLIPIVTAEPTSHLSGLTLKNVVLCVKDGNGHTVFSEMGELLFTHFGLSGPLVLSASAHMRDGAETYTVHVDLKPAIDEKTLDARLVADFSKYSAKNFSNSLSGLLPRTLIPEIIARSGISPYKKTSEVTKAERRVLLGLLKDLEFTPTGFRPVDEAIVTRGGVDIAAILPSTMEARAVKGLYFAGEVIDVDAYTGGYNLQIAFATGRLAGSAAGRGIAAE